VHYRSIIINRKWPVLRIKPVSPKTIFLDRLLRQYSQQYKDLMIQVEDDANCQLTKVQEEAKEKLKFLAHFTVDHN
jgi:hypothetical protein